MGRILAIDYGTRRVGLAVTDPLRIVAGALTTIEEKEVLSFLTTYIPREQVDIIVIGLPMRLDGSDTHATEPVKKFIAALRTKFPAVKIDTADERFTSVMARRTLVEMGLKKKDREKKENTDQVSATILLQTYLDTNP